MYPCTLAPRPGRKAASSRKQGVSGHARQPKGLPSKPAVDESRVTGSPARLQKELRWPGGHLVKIDLFPNISSLVREEAASEGWRPPRDSSRTLL